MSFVLRFRRRSTAGFSLVEILLVLAIIAILTVASVTSIQGILLSANLSSSAVVVIDALNLARQQALSSNLPVEFRIYQVPANNSSTLTYRAVGIYKITTNGPVLVSKIMYLNGNVVLSNSTTFGTLLAYTASSTGPLIPNGPGPNYTYQYFQFRSDGSTSLTTQPVASDTWHVMLYNSNRPPSGTTPPSNYVSIQIDPTSGRTEVFQP